MIASADRRPVDPPPVVELRIFEGNSWAEAETKDITFLYNANFFLYTTLEHARVIAHGRLQTPAANQPPVLTGVPVSGMAYLDRPQEAGYFLFPDLSVRHEGRYRLNFVLYEETKEDKDMDPDTPDPKVNAPQAIGGSFDFRMEVKSVDFTVFSAKKFPGLKESTALSRTVAEQGCRVRIRRDVRMRRRDGKPSGGDYEAQNQSHREDEYASRHRRTETPELKHNFRPRSTSGSVDRNSFSSEAQRRPSGADYPPPPLAAHQPHSAGGHLQFLGSRGHVQYPHQSQGSSRPPSMPPSPSAYQTSHASPYSPHHPLGQQMHQHIRQQYSQAQPLPQQPGQRSSYGAPAPQHQAYHQQDRSQSMTQHCPPPSPLPREAASREFREPPPPPSMPPQYQHSPAARALSEKPTLPGITTRGPDSWVLPPLKGLDIAQPRRIPPLLSSPTDCDPPLQAMPTRSSLAPPPAPVITGAKRSRDDNSWCEVEAPRYNNGAREEPVNHQEPELNYRRADGKWVSVAGDVIRI